MLTKYGCISKYGLQSIRYHVQSIKDLAIIIDHFERYPLITQKRSDYELFKQVFYIIKNKEHLTMDGLNKIVAIRASWNLGLSVAARIKAAFPAIIPIQRPLTLDQKISDPYWLAGFTTGEGCFFVSIPKSKSHKLGTVIQLRFHLAQHNRDSQLIESLVEYLGCGKVYRRSGAVDFTVTTFSDLTCKVLPFFLEHLIEGVKSKDFEDFCKVADIMKEKGHLTTEGWAPRLKYLKSKRGWTEEDQTEGTYKGVYQNFV